MHKYSLQEIFRGLIIASTTCFLLAVASPWIFWHGVLQETSDVLNWDGVGAFLPLPSSVRWLLVLLWVAVPVGIYQFSPQARFVFALLTCLGLVATLTGGMMVRLAPEAFLEMVATLMDGAILALAYLSPLKEKFQNG